LCQLGLLAQLFDVRLAFCLAEQLSDHEQVK
jgi:hypothetical protein